MGHMPRASFMLPWMLEPEVAMRTGKIPRATRGLTLRRGRRAPGRKPPHVCYLARAALASILVARAAPLLSSLALNMVVLPTLYWRFGERGIQVGIAEGAVTLGQ